ncbi:MAG: PD-(D/E)XK nuclease family protein [Candidatus Bathyarchaeia archaeon]
MIKQILSAYLIKENKPRQIGIYYPSRLPYCLRQQYYEWLLGVEYPEELLRIFEIGNIFHEWLKRVFKNVEGVKLLENEKPINVYLAEVDIFINGRIDDVILIEADNQTYIIEAKTHRNLNFLEGAHKEHIAQLNFYLKFYPSAKGIILYLEKNTLKTREFMIEFNQSLFKETLERAKILHNALLAKKPPPPEKSPLCQYCLFKEKCERNE